ncbi:MAG: outer membrane beta-barrel protein [Tannerellaceae bacterium]|nr:outer membrane beta-barrel protein [Tannerellaceae bacterium]
MKERDEIDNIFRSGLHDWEADTLPEDWEAIAGRLDEGKRIPLRRTLRYWVAAAVASVVVVTGGLYWYNLELPEVPVARQLQLPEEFPLQPLAQGENTLPQVVPAEKTIPATRPVVAVAKPIQVTAPADTEGADMVKRPVVPVTPETKEKEAVTPIIKEDKELADVASSPVTLLADAGVVAKKEEPVQRRRWSLGMGGGSVTAGSAENSIQTFALRTTTQQSEELMYLNSAASNFTTELPKTNIRHKTPVSVGVSVSYALNDRFSLLSGLTYSLLRSDWKTNGQYHGETVQKLHFLGLPLSVAYKIAEWNNFHFYAAAGGMTEVNVAGRVQSKIMQDNNEIIKRNESERMQEWLWSVNARVGVSYPVFRYASLFAEIGASYYFDNGSSIETIHSEKPFNVNLQFGVRLGF